MPPQRSSIEHLNALSSADFNTRFWPSNLSHTGPSGTRPNDGPWALELYTSHNISFRGFNDCFNLIHESSSKQYAASSLGWHPQKKKQEMRLQDLKYIVGQKGDNSPENPIDGFLSFMLTYEDGIEVIYCYELHVAERCRGSGLGKSLMGHMEVVGRKAGVKKAMLTVFRANEQARGFYAKLGYEVDDYSPQPKLLRGGIVKEADYLILSKPLIQDVEGPDEDRSVLDEEAKTEASAKEKYELEETPRLHPLGSAVFCSWPERVVRENYPLDEDRLASRKKQLIEEIRESDAKFGKLCER